VVRDHTLYFLPLTICNTLKDRLPNTTSADKTEGYVLTATAVKNTVFWDLMPGSVVNI
jgi:hypothetical protein